MRRHVITLGVFIVGSLLCAQSVMGGWEQVGARAVQAASRTEEGRDFFGGLIVVVIIIGVIVAIIAAGVHLGNAGQKGSLDSYIQPSSTYIPSGTTETYEQRINRLKQEAASSVQGVTDESKSRGQRQTDYEESVCPKCGLACKAGNKFCGNCGSPIATATVCGKCNSQLEPNARFCGNCGVGTGQQLSNIKVEVSKIARQGTALNGNVTFASGVKTDWFVDQSGKLGLENATGKPTPEDIQEFQVELQKILSTQVG